MCDVVLFYVPDIGTRIRLMRNWTFDLYAHPDNLGLGKALGVWGSISTSKEWLSYKQNWKQVLWRAFVPTGTELTIKKAHMGPSEEKNLRGLRFYVPKGMCHDKRFEKTRFWAPLDDVNKIVCQIMGGPDGKTSMKSVEMVESRWDLME